MEEDVQALKDVSFYMINIYPKEGLKKIAEAGKIGGEIQEYLNIILIIKITHNESNIQHIICYCNYSSYFTAVCTVNASCR